VLLAYSGGATIFTLESIVRQSPNIVSRTIAGEAVLVPIARSAEEMDAIYTLNETASTIWEALDGQRTLGEVLALVLQAYEVEAEQAQNDLFELLEQLAAVRAIEAGSAAQAEGAA